MNMFGRYTFMPALTAALLVFGPAAHAALSDPIEAAFVALGPDGTPTARVITKADSCPAMTVDGKQMEMELRAAPSVEPLRPTISPQSLSKPSDFPVRVCDLVLTDGTKAASVDGRPLPLPPAEIRRIVVIGDTGCRIKAIENAAQDCNDTAAYPFARIAARAAAWKPDAVLHVGDYLYRETPCPASKSGCAHSPWGYGWDAWDADFFSPGKPLLEAAPWILVRGNHENCNRAGQGWWRLLDPRPLEPGRDCNDPANDLTGNFSPTYAVPLGDGAQVAVMDLSAAGSTPYLPGDPRIERFGKAWEELNDLSAKADFTFATDHYPIFGVAIKDNGGRNDIVAGNPAIAQAFAPHDPNIVPAGVDVLLAGHVHLWEQVDFGGAQPSQFIAGFSGTQEDTVPLPKSLPEGMSPAPHAPVRHFDRIIDRFGYMTLERTGKQSWSATVYGLKGGVMRNCTIEGRKSECTR